MNILRRACAARSRNDEPKQELLPESDTDFFSTTSDDVFTFETDS